MLAKLFKYDIKSIGKTLFPLSLVLLLSTAIGAIGILLFEYFPNIGGEHSGVKNVAEGVGVSIYALSYLALFAFAVISFFIIFQRFYKSCFSDEGYLTFTLPVTVNQLLLSKLLSAVVWAIYSMIMVAISFFVLTFLAALLDGNLANYLYSLYDGLINYWWSHLVKWLVSAFFNGLQSIMTLFLSITIGAIVAKKHKILAAVGFYYIIVTVTSIIGGIVSVIAPGLLVECAISVGFCAAAYAFCVYLMKNKLNLS